jgi:hypothetical protein
MNLSLSEKASSAGNQQETSFSYNLINHKWGILRDYTPDTIELSDELVSLIALLYTDGGISKHRLSSWRIFFGNSSKKGIELFKKCLVNVFKISPDRVKARKRQERHYFAVLTSKEIGNFLIKSFGHFRTLKFSNGEYPMVSIPVSKLITCGKVGIFLKTVFSMDGGVKFYIGKSKRNHTRWLERNIFLACYHPVLRRQYQNLLKSLEIESINIESDKVIKIRRRENLEKFAHKVGFVEGIKTTRHSKFWIGIEKNEVLKLMVDSYSNPSKYLSLPQFQR